MLIEDVVKEIKEDLITIFDKEPKIKITKDYITISVPSEKFVLTLYLFSDDQFSAILDYGEERFVSSEASLSEIRDLILKKVCNL
jgi:hypothetical protein